MMLEEKKKTMFNNRNGKTEYTIIKGKTKKEDAIAQKVRKGGINKVKEHKALGMWIDEEGTYKINIEKNKKRVPHMIETVKAIGCSKSVGILAVTSRLKLCESIIIPSILYNVEVVASLSKKEMKDLEILQGEIVTRILEVPRSTPYMGILMETGMWTMEARVSYKKLMLYHNIWHSDEERIMKKIVKVQA